MSVDKGKASPGSCRYYRPPPPFGTKVRDPHARQRSMGTHDLKLLVLNHKEVKHLRKYSFSLQRALPREKGKRGSVLGLAPKQPGRVSGHAMVQAQQCFVKTP